MTCSTPADLLGFGAATYEALTLLLINAIFLKSHQKNRKKSEKSGEEYWSKLGGNWRKKIGANLKKFRIFFVENFEKKV